MDVAGGGGVAERWMATSTEEELLGSGLVGPFLLAALTSFLEGVFRWSRFGVFGCFTVLEDPGKTDEAD